MACNTIMVAVNKVTHKQSDRQHQEQHGPTPQPMPHRLFPEHSDIPDVVDKLPISVLSTTHMCKILLTGDAKMKRKLHILWLRGRILWKGTVFSPFRFSFFWPLRANETDHTDWVRHDQLTGDGSGETALSDFLRGHALRDGVSLFFALLHSGGGNEGVDGQQELLNQHVQCF